jgi:3-hydroxyisobutyrate dehydrogenase-like beta-hydroxyacid dehydrogenase
MTPFSDPLLPLFLPYNNHRLALDLATSLGVSLPTTSACDAQYQSVLEERGDEDFSAVYVASKKAKKNP